MDDLIPYFADRPNLLIGQAPQRDPKTLEPWWRPWDSDSGRRLAKKLGITHEKMMELFDTTNLNKKLLGTSGKWDQFGMTEARERAEQLLDLLPIHYDLILCAGKRVAELMDAPFLEVRELGSGRIAGIPHPGGTNRWWNSQENRERGNAFLAELGESLLLRT
jgi:uracil-DNA glycosylase